MSDPARHAQRPVRSFCAWHRPAGTPKQNVWSGFMLVSQSVSCCHAGKCSLVFSKDLLTNYIVFCANNLSGYLKHVVELTGAIWSSSDQLASGCRSPDNFTSRETWQLSNESRWISANSDAFSLHSKLPIIPWKKCMKLNNKMCVDHYSLNESFGTTINRFVKL